MKLSGVGRGLHQHVLGGREPLAPVVKRTDVEAVAMKTPGSQTRLPIAQDLRP